MTRPNAVLAVIGLGALAASVLAGLGVHGVREGAMGYTREETGGVESVGDVLRAALWELRVAVADLTFLEAEVAFHRGLRDESELHLESSPLRPWVPEHVHDMENIDEMMPWIWMTTVLNPHHTRAFAMGGYYLSWQLDRPEEALSFLDEGVRENPENGLIALTIGRIHMMHRRDPQAALPHLQRATACEFEDSENALFATRYLAHALRLTGQWEEGEALWERQTAAHPEDPAYAQGLVTYHRLVSDPETRESFTLHELSTADAQALEDQLCPFGHDHSHEDEHDHHDD